VQRAAAQGVDVRERTDALGLDADSLVVACGALSPGVALAGVVNMLDVDTVVLGGIFGPLAHWLAPAVEAELSRRVLTSAWSPMTVRASALGPAAAAVGAAGAVVRDIVADPAEWVRP